MYDKEAVEFYNQARALSRNGNLSDALASYKKALAISPNFVEAWNNLGNTLVDLGNNDEATDAYREALSLSPDHPMLLNNLANGLRQQGNSRLSLDYLQRAIDQDSKYVDAHINKGFALFDLGKLDAAIGSYQTAIGLDPSNKEALNGLGNALLANNRPADAIESFTRAIHLDRMHKEAYHGLGNAFKNLGRLNQAAEAYQQAIKYDPENKRTHQNLGDVLSGLGDIYLAQTSFQRAIEIDPSFAKAHIGLGNTFMTQDKVEEALHHFRIAIENQPHMIEALEALATAYTDIGEFNQALKLLRKIIRLDPEHAKSFRAIALMKKFKKQDNDLKAMLALYEKATISNDQKLSLAFSLGKAYEDLGDYEKSMRFIIEGNGLKRRSIEHSLDQEIKLVDSLKRVFTTDFFRHHESTGLDDQTSIFILGMPRSGTSLVEQILASHPDVYGAGELLILPKLVETISDNRNIYRFAEAVSMLPAADFKNLAQDYLNEIRKLYGDARYITDKMMYNFFSIGLIRLMLPNAKIIHCTRNPMDNCLSLFKNLFNYGNFYSYDQSELGEYYNLYVELMTHWKQTLPDFIYDLQYENLVADTENQIGRLLEYCELPWEDNCLDFFQTRRKVKTNSNVQVRQPVYQDSVELWKRYEQQLEPLRLAIYGA